MECPYTTFCMLEVDPSKFSASLCEVLWSIKRADDHINEQTTYIKYKPYKVYRTLITNAAENPHACLKYYHSCKPLKSRNCHPRPFKVMASNITAKWWVKLLVTSGPSIAIIHP